MFKKLQSIAAVAKAAVGSSAIELRFGTLEKARDELDRLVQLKGECHPASPRTRLLDRQCKAAQHLVAQHELRANKSSADRAADRDARVATAALEKAMESITGAKDRLQQQSNDRSRLSSRVDKAQAEFDRLKLSAEASLTARQSDFDAAMSSGDDAAQTASAEALSNARRMAAEFSDGASHPLRLRLAALQGQVAAASDSANDLAQQIDAAERERKEAEVTLAQIASDQASNAALEAFAVALALTASVNRTRPSTMEGVYFWSPERCYAQRYIGVLGRGGFVTGHGIQQLGEIAREPDVHAFDNDPLQLPAQIVRTPEEIEDEERSEREREERAFEASLPIDPHSRVEAIQRRARERVAPVLARR